MKNLSLCLLMGALLVLNSCKKETFTPKSTLHQSESALDESDDQLVSEPTRPGFDNLVSDDRDGPGRTWYDQTSEYGPDAYGCLSFPTDCWNTVVVSVSQEIEDYTNVFEAVESGIGIVDAFTAHYDLLIEHIDSDLVDEVIGESVLVRSKGDFDTRILYLQFYNASTEALLAVYPYEQ